MRLDPFLLALSLLLSSPHGPPLVAAAKSTKQPKNAILLSEVQSLTLRSDKTTTHRRVPALPQLKCISSPSICHLYSIDVMRCTNQGSGYESEDIQWSCAANLPPELKLGSTDVICEGYSGPDDPYIFRGSCGVEYRLVLTDEGEKKYPDAGKGRWGGGGGRGRGSDWSAWLFGVIFVGVCVWILYNAFFAAQANRTRAPAQRRPRGWGGGGGGGPGGFGPGAGGGGGFYGTGGDDTDPPPPYTPKASSSTSTRGQNQGWQPGFWSGLAGGAAAGYFAGGRHGSRNNGRQDAPPNYGSGWGSRGSSSSSGSSPGSGFASSSRYESTGFGGTSRR